VTKEEIIAAVRGNNRVVVWLTEQASYIHIPFNDISVWWGGPEEAIKQAEKALAALGLSVDDILFVEGVNGIAALDAKWDGSNTFVCEDPSCKVVHSVDQMLADRLFQKAFPGAKWYQLGDYEKAAKAFHEVVRLNPSYVHAWYNLGTAYEGLRQYGQAARAFQEAIRLKPDLAAAWGHLGNAYRGLGQFDQAVEAFQQTVRLKPDDAEAWCNLGAAYDLQGNRAKVMQVYGKLKSLDRGMADEFFQRVVLPYRGGNK